MRIYLRTTPNTELVPFNYQSSLVGAMHKWIGKNTIHDQLSLYSLSWLFGGESNRKGLMFPKGANFFISSPDTAMLKSIIRGIQNDPEIRWGMNVKEVILSEPPKFSKSQKFFLQSPVLIKRSFNGRIKFFFPEDTESGTYLTETLKNKLRKAGLGDLNVAVRFDRTYQASTKLIDYNGIKNRAAFCPVIIEGDPEALTFAWDVGIGNSTGIGFGALK